MRLGRREFITLAGGVAGGAALGRVSLRGISRLNEALEPPSALYPGEEQWLRSICSLCSGGCGLKVRTVGGRVIKVDGNPIYPVNRDGICPRGQTLTQLIYHPDRILAPAHRSAIDQPWETSSWDQTLESLASTLRRLRGADQQNRVLMVSGRSRGLTSKLCSHFLSSYGSNHFFELPSGMETSQRALEFMAGIPNDGKAYRMAYDLENSRYILNFGCDLLEGWGTPAHTMRLFGQWRDIKRGRRTTLIHFGPRLSVTAARSDEWVPVEVGTLGAMALGIAFVLISEDLYNRSFVESFSFGFEDWTDRSGQAHMGFRRWVREEYRLSRVSEITGISSETIVRIAREFAAQPGSIAIGPQQSPVQPGRLSDAMAIQALNALVGSIGTRGGVSLIPEFGWPLPVADGNETMRTASLDGLVAVLDQSPEVLILDQAARFIDSLDDAHLDMLNRIPLIVSTSPVEDATSKLATLLLPDCTSLESWTDGQSPSAYPYDLIALTPPVIPPRGDSRPWGETLLALARMTDPALESVYPWKDMESLYRASANELSRRENGYLFGTQVDEQWQRMLERSGWWNPDWTSEDEFWDGLVNKGGWWDPATWVSEPQHSFQTVSGKFEFFSQRLEALLREKGGIQPGLQPSVEWDRQILPHHADILPDNAPEGFEWTLDPYEPLVFFGGASRQIPFLQQITSPYSGPRGWRSWIEMSAEDAHRMGIEEDETVWVESARSRIQRRVRILEGGKPGIVGAPLGGAPTTGRWARVESTLAEILVPISDPYLGVRSHATTRVKIYKA